MIRLDSYGNKIDDRGVIRTDSGNILSVDASEYMTEKELLEKYFPSKILIAEGHLDGYECPIEKGDKYALVDGEPWYLFDLVITPQPLSSLGITEFQPNDRECIIWKNRINLSNVSDDDIKRYIKP